MAERELAIILRAKDLASRQIAGVQKQLGGLGKVGARAFNGLTTAVTRLGIAAAVGLAGGIAMGVRSLADLQRTTAQTNAVIESTGGKAGVTAEEVRKLAEELENLTTVDDKVIQDGENMLLTFTGISDKVFPRATKATLNLAVAMAKGDASQVDMKASAIQVGKALNDPIKGVTALRKVGVAFTEQQVKQIKAMVKSGDVLGAQTIILRELETEFGKAGEAAGKGPAATWRRLQDVGEDLSQALAKRLLPVLERAGTWLTTKLADPAVSAALDEIGAGLADAATEALKFVEAIDFKALGSALRTAAGFAGGLVKAFMGMPEWVKVAVISGWGLNKLTGGAVGGIIGELGKGLIKGVLGMNAGVVNINAAVVNGAGGIPGAAAPAAAAPAKGLLATAAGGIGIGLALPVAIGLLPTVMAEALKATGNLTPQQVTNARAETAAARGLDPSKVRQGFETPVGGLTGGWKKPIPVTFTKGQFGGQSPDDRGQRRVAGEAAVLQRATAAGLKPTADQITRTYNATSARQEAASRTVVAAAQAAAFATRDGTSQIVAAVNRISIPAPSIYVTAADNKAADVRRHRTVKPGGTRNTYTGWRTDG